MVAVEVDDGSVQLLTIDVDFFKVALALHHGSIPIRFRNVHDRGYRGLSGLVGRVRPMEHSPRVVGEPKPHA